MADHTKTVREGLEAAQKLIDEALPKFDWSKSALDGNAIMLLNETPKKVRAALEALTEVEKEEAMRSWGDNGNT